MSQEFRDAVRERSRVEGDLVIVDAFVNHMIERFPGCRYRRDAP